MEEGFGGLGRGNAALHEQGGNVGRDGQRGGERGHRVGVGGGQEIPAQGWCKYGHLNSRNSFKSTHETGVAGWGVPLADSFVRAFMQKLRAFYRKYRQYILSDGLMYVVFILALALLFVFFG